MRDKSIYFKLASSYFIWSFLGLILNRSSFSAFQTSFLISFFAVFWYILLMFFKGEISSIKKIKINLTLLFFVLISGVGGVLWMKSLTLIPISSALFLFASLPIFALLIEIFFFKQKSNFVHSMSIILGLIGMLALVSDGLRQNISFLSIASTLVLIASLLFAIQGFVIKKISSIYKAEMISLIFMFSQGLISAPFALSTSWNFEVYPLFLTIIFSFFSAIFAFYFYMESLKFLKVSTVRLIGYTEVLFGSIWGVIFLSQALKFLTAIAGVLILTASYLASKSSE